jgi:hypothetical protein
MANIAFRERLRADAAAVEHAADERVAEAEVHAQQRITEIEAQLRCEYEENRALELAKSYRLGAINERNGVHAREQPPTGELIVLSERRRQTAAIPRSGTGAPGGDLGLTT